MATNLMTKVMRAEIASDLSEHTEAVQIVRAAGIAGVRKRLGSLLPRFLSSGGHENRSVLLDLLTLAVAREYPALSSVERRAVATGALYLYLVPRCVVCSGRGFELRPDTPTLSDVACKSCQGSGRNELRDAEKVKGPLAWAQNQIAGAEQKYSAAVGRKLGRD
jgi:hypothetical protein